MSNIQNCAILGGGILGQCVAYTLLKQGHKITLYDPAYGPDGFPLCGASGVAGGMLAPYSELDHMDLSWVEAGLASIALWRKILENREDQGDFSQNGSLLLAHPQDRYILERFAAHLPEGMNAFTDVGPLEPALGGRFAQGLFLSKEAHLHPAKVMKILYDDLKDKITIMPQAAHPSAVSSDYDVVMDCRGLGARDSDQELRGVKGEIVVVRNAALTLSRPVRLMHPRYPLYIVPRQGHVFMIGATQIESEDGTHVSVRSALELMSALYAVHPSFGEAEICEILTGLRPSYPDNLPRVYQEGKVIRVNGSFRHGFLLAPLMAQCAADLLTGLENPYTLLFQGKKA